MDTVIQALQSQEGRLQLMKDEAKYPNTLMGSNATYDLITVDILKDKISVKYFENTENDDDQQWVNEIVYNENGNFGLETRYVDKVAA